MRKKEYACHNLLLEDMKGEEWKDIPGLTDYYQISNYGRVKSLERWVERPVKGDMLLKERILRQTILKSFNPYTRKSTTCLRVTFCTKRVKQSITPSRIVYYLFVKKFDLNDPTLVVVPADNDIFNSYYKNLRLIKKGEVQIKTYREKRKKKLFKPVSQYDTRGYLIKTYPSITEAGKETGFYHNTISQAANGHKSHCGGRQWKFGDRKKIKAIKFPYRHVKRVGQYTVKGKLIHIFFSINEAARVTGFDDMGIRDTAKKRRVVYKGFSWKYVD